jgi:hypothetical protein
MVIPFIHYTLVTLSIYMKTKIRGGIRVTEEADKALDGLLLMYPYMSLNAVINHALIGFFAAGGVNKHVKAPDLEDNPKLEMERKEEREARAKKWAEKYGATVSAHHTMYMKYEKTFGGEVVKNKRATPVEELPTTEDGVRRLILGPFISVQEAEAAWVEQNATTGAGSKKETKTE